MPEHRRYIAQNVTFETLVTYVTFLNVLVFFFSVESKMVRKCLYFTIATVYFICVNVLTLCLP